MSELRVQPSDLRASAGVCTTAAGEIRGTGSSQHLAGIGSAVPGSAAIDRFNTLGPFWDKESQDTATSTQTYADGLRSTADSVEAADRAAHGQGTNLAQRLGAGG